MLYLAGMRISSIAMMMSLSALAGQTWIFTYVAFLFDVVAIACVCVCVCFM